MTKRLYFTCPIKALYMMKEFGVGFILEDEEDLRNYLGVGMAQSDHGFDDKIKTKSKFFVEKTSEHIFKLQKEDLLNYKNCESILKWKLQSQGKNSPKNYKIDAREFLIIMRDNKQFFMPEGKMKGKIFNAQEVQAIISGNKTKFREVIKPQPKSNINPVKLANLTRTWQWATKESRRECPYQIGQKIFCKESFSMSRGLEYHQCHDAWYWADGNPESGDWTKPKPAQHMKQEHSRLTLQIKEVRVERFDELWNWVIDFEVVK